MKKGLYSYQIFVPVGTQGFYRAVRVQWFRSLSDARLYARERCISVGYIAREHCFYGLEDKTYSL